MTSCATTPQPQHSSRLRARVLADLPLLLTDVVLVSAAYVVALVLRFDAAVPSLYWHRLPTFLVLAACVHVALHIHFGLYGPLWLEAGAREAWRLVVAVSAATSLLVAATLLSGAERYLPLSVPLNAGALAMLMLGGARFSTRILAVARRGGSAADDATRVVVVGPVAQVRGVLTQIAMPGSHLKAVGVLTDESSAWGRTVVDVPVDGPCEGLVAAVRRHDAAQVLVVRSGDEIDGEQVGRLAELSHAAGVSLKVMPGLHETWGRPPRLRDIRPIGIEDLLGREPVEVDVLGMRRTVAGRRVLITGGGGSIGSEIAAQVALLDPADLVLLDHDETHLHDAMALLQGPGRSVLGDIRDEAFLDRLFEAARPEVVFHAAAHKHVPILEQFPSEAVLTNVLGTDLVVSAALRHGTRSFVGISTDKAVNPRSVMGASKRLAEQVLVQRSGDGMRYCVVRFGNVLGSRGSVVPTFVRQALSGGPVTVTHPDMTRFFMTTREAVQLVLQAASTCSGGEIFMLDMGEPVRIVELAEHIISLTASRREDDVRIEFTGLRPGEKLTEQLASEDEVVEPTGHPRIHRVRSPLISTGTLFQAVSDLIASAEARDEERVRCLLFQIADHSQVIDLVDRGLVPEHSNGEWYSDVSAVSLP